MARYSEESIRRVLEALDIVEVIERYLPLRKAGTVYKGLCPFHHEKTPSFTVNQDRQIFKCFGCGESGGAIGFVMKYENLRFGEALRKLAEQSGTLLVEENESAKDIRERRMRSQLILLHSQVTTWMSELLLKDPAAAHARQYLKARGYSKEMILRWNIGWMPDLANRFFDWVRAGKWSGKELLASGLCKLRDEANPRAGLTLRFRNRLMFPISNDYGEIIAFSGRILENNDRLPKYVNSPETEIFRKGNVVFGLNMARRAISKEECVVICEGQLDCIACHEAGIENVVAPLGTAFTPEHAHLLRRYSQRALICLDGDKAGRVATDRVFRELIQVGMRVDVASLPDGEDPDSIIKSQGVNALKALLDGAESYFSVKIKWAKLAGLLKFRPDRVEFARELAQMLAIVPDAVNRDAMTLDVSARLQLGADEMRGLVESIRKNTHFRTRRFEPKVVISERVIPAKLDSFTRSICELALTHSKARNLLRERIEEFFEAFEYCEGGNIASEIVRNGPDPVDPVRVLAYLETLKIEWQHALLPLLAVPAPDDFELAVDQIISGIGRMISQRKIEAILAEIHMDGLPIERQIELMEKLKRLRSS